MNGKTYAYLDIAALPGVGPLLLDPRPAFAFRADGSGIVWANAAGAAFFGEATMQALLARRFSPTSPLARHLALLAKQLSSDRPRLEILRFGFGSTETTLAAACQKLSLAGGANAVLIIAANNPTRESLATRAERLADAIADADCLAAVLDSDGKVLGASGGFAALAPAEEAIDRLIEDADRSDRRLAKRELRVGDMTRPAGAARVVAGNERFFLLIVGPEESNPRAVVPAVLVAAEPVKVAQDEPMPTSPDTATATDVVAEPAPAERVRFFWQLNAELRFSFVSDTLGAVVGPGHAPVAGMAWADVAAGLALDPSGAVAEALARRTSWSGIAVYWPVEGAAERIVVELSAVPSIAADRSFAGYRGFGVALPGDRRPDERPFPGLAAPAAPLEEAAPAAVEDSAPAPAALPPTEPLPPIAVQAEPPEVLPEAPARPIPPPSGTPATEVDIDDVARKSIEQGTLTRPADRPPPTHEPPAIIQYADPRQPGSAVSNVVRLPGTPTRALPRRLTGTEQDAFRRIAEALGARTADEAAAAASTARTEPPADRPEFDERLLDRLPVGLVVHRDGRTLFANRAALDLLGYASLGAFRAAGGAEAILPAGALPAPGGDGMLDVLRADGSRALVAARLHAVTWSGSTALMLSLMEREPPLPSPAPKDEAPPEPTPAAARIAELETILDTATDGVIVIDETGRIATINRSAEALFGIAAGEVRGRPFTELLAEESRRAALDYLDGLASNGVASVLNDGREVIGKVPAGGLIPLFMTMGRLGDSGKYCAVLRDITHWKNVEEELVAARRAAETANAQKSDFLAKISHEIRTPLNAIIGFSEVMMEERFGPVGNDRYRAYLRDIHLSGEHLMSLINDLLDLSKIEAGKLELKSEAVLVNEVIQECVALMQPQANRERIIIRTSLAADVPPVVADLRSFRQILLNLLSNAVKFTRAGGQVIVATALEESGEVVVRIRDTGIGMSDKEMETAMKPFRQIATSGRAREGTGLGLPLTKALVEANRAAFSIDSVPNQGTLVRVTFPTTRVLAG